MIYLASRSPRRRELLSQIGVRYHLLLVRAAPGRPSDVDETPLEGEAPRDYVRRMAREKAESACRHLASRSLPRAPVLAADTTVALGARIFGKPADRREAARMLEALGGRTHEVLSAVVLADGERAEEALSVSQVRFRPLGAGEIARYVASGECDDKAGAYAIQGRAARFVAELRGSYSGVMGLPLYETAELLERLGVPA